MYKSLIYSLTLLISTTASAQDTAEVPPFYSVQQCDTFLEVAKVAKQFDEDTLFTGEIIQQHTSGQYVNSQFVFTVNQDSGTWSLISLFPNGWACQVASGFKFEPYTK